MKTILFCIALLTLSLNVKAVKIKFTAANMSVNVAEGTIGIFTSFRLFPDDFENTDSLNVIDFVDFPFIAYDDIVGVAIEKTMLTSQNTPVFNRMATFVMTDSSTNGNFTDSDILQGATYVFRLIVTDKNGLSFNLLNRELTTQLADPTINCAKLNNVYRLAGHNTYQTNVSSSLYFSMFYTRVLELDVHASNNPTTWNWSVRHIGSGNNNNCRSGNEPFGICIDEIKRWHNNHPNHDVIILFIDLKSEWNENNNGQTPADLDQRLLSLVPNSDMIYKPRDLIGNNSSNMRLAAWQNNWPSMGDLTGKFIFVLTGKTSRLNDYMSQRGLDGIAFSALSVETQGEAISVSGVSTGLVPNIVFYNVKRSKDLNVGMYAHQNGYMSRVWNSTTFGAPKAFSNSEYNEAINFQLNNIAVKDIDGNYNPTNNGVPRPINGIQYIQAIAPNPYPTAHLFNNHIFSSYANVTQAALNNIATGQLIVEPGTHYRMIAGNSIDLQPGVDIKQGSDVDIRIDDCRYADYTQRKSIQKGEQLTQEEIDKIMHELNKELYGYQPESEKEIIHLMVYPNPTSNFINISYTNYLLNNATFTLYDITGRLLKTKNYTTQNEGKQQISFSIAELKEGTYFYTLQVGEQTYNGKVVKINQ